ncbi:MAG: glycoside hydrolase family 38 C-terminal domain-containing protein [Gemmatimonadales bacterium]
MSPSVHIVPHTHWDREWYRSAAEFELRLAHLVDDVLGSLESGAARSFLLDGQAIVLDDFAQARPTRLARLARQLRSGRLECGPWYVLADNLLVSGEAMVRNLIEGGRSVRRYGGRPMPVGYAPDTFGHPGILPTILAGFGIETAVTWRGFGGARGQEKDLYRWAGPDGGEVVMIHLPPVGYENGANLPVEPALAAQRWKAMRAVLVRRARSPLWLVMNGADHHVLQPDLKAAVRRLQSLASDCAFEVTSFATYARAVTRWAEREADLPVIRGELREGRRHAWVLQGTHSARLYLKQANTACQRLLERVAEPLVVLQEEARGARRERGGALQARGLREDLRVAWRALLENHPHDSICGTSADVVHREMMTRFDRVGAMGEEIVGSALDAAIGFDADAARAAGREKWRPGLVLFNPTARAWSGVALARVALFKADVRVGQQGSTSPAVRRPGEMALLDGQGKPLAFQELGREDGHDRLESPRYYPDSDSVEWRHVAIAVKDLPPLGLTTLKVEERAVRPSARPPVRPVRVSDLSLEDEHVEVRIEPEGTVSLADAEGRGAHRLGAIECVRDEGDSYTSSPRGPNLTESPDAVAVRIVHEGPLRGEIEIRRRFARAGLEVTTRVRLDAGSRHVVLSLAFENTHGNRRVRAAFPLGERALRVSADGPFGPVERAVQPVKKRAGDLEAPDPCAPMQRFVSVAGKRAGLTVFSDGLPQYEARPDGRVFVTLLRSFDQMSRGDIPERVGNAGWPTPTPEARCLGPVRARLALMLHDPFALDSREEIEAAAEAFLAPPIGFMRRALLEAPAPVPGPELIGRGLAFSAMKAAESGRGVVLRCYNATTKTVRGAWRVTWPVRSATLCRLDEKAMHKLEVDAGGRVAFDAPPRAVVTILLR